jgi:predicted metalloprotease
MVERERETIVTTDNGGGRGGGTLLAVVLLIALLVVLFLLFGRGLLGGTTEKIDADVDVTAPAGGGGTDK